MAKISKYLFLIGLFILTSCNKDRAKVTITDFSKSQKVTLTPYNWKMYSMLNLKVKGYTNDTILIKSEGVYNFNIRLSGKIDTIFKTDYYGEGVMTYTILPYKATKGELEIDINL